MKEPVEARTRLALIVAITAAVFLTNSVQSLAALNEKAPAAASNAQAIDLRPAMKTMTLKDGSKVMREGAGHKLIAEVRGGKIVRWSATDDKGNPLQTQVAAQGVECQICVTLPNNKTECYKIDCSQVPAPKPPKSQ